MSTDDFPEFGDAQLLPKGTIRRPSAERQPFDNSGRLKPGGPGPLTEERFYEHPDLAKLPQWNRTRGNEWTDQPFRKIVMAFLVEFFRERDWPLKWDIKEVAGAVQSMNRLSDDRVYLVIGVTPKAGSRVETSITFPGVRADNPVGVIARLDLAAVTLDALFAAQ